jgi:hypothetical protein
LNNLFRLGKSVPKKAAQSQCLYIKTGLVVVGFDAYPLFPTKIITFAAELVFTVIAIDQSLGFYLDNG